MRQKNTKGNLPQGVTLYLRVLGYKKDTKTWAAHCLETDLVGYGKSFSAALHNLIELTEMQVSFSIYKNEPALLNRPAPPDIIETYNRLFSWNLENLSRPEKRDRKRMVTSIPLPTKPLNLDFNIVPMQAS